MTNNERLFNGICFGERTCVIKETRIVTKYKDTAFPEMQTAIIPSTLYPVPGKYEIFTSDNTFSLQTKDGDVFTSSSEENTNILDIFDKQQFEMAKCYANADRLTLELRQNGYDAETYVGWLLMSNTMPVHHAWTVLRQGNSVSVLDLSNHFYHQFADIQRLRGLSLDEQRLAVAKKEIELEKLRNSQRCVPVGVPCPNMLYIGCKQSGNEGYKVFVDLMDKYPHHPAHKKLSHGLTRTQNIFMANRKK